MTRRTLVKFITNLFAFATVASAQQSPDQNVTLGYSVSLIKVISNPHDFDGKRLGVIGWLWNNGGADQSFGVYVSEVDGRNAVIPNSVDVDVDESAARLRGRYVSFSGVYHAPDPRAGFNGHFDQIMEMRQWATVTAK